MALTIRKDGVRYHLVDKETGKIKKSFDTRGEALVYDKNELQKRDLSSESTKYVRGGKQ